MSLPLEGIRVVDFSRVLAGPHCAKTLLDLGAEVIKLEPPRGDLSRRAFPSRGEISGYYSQQNAGKRNVSIDLNAPGARNVALRLCDTADVIVENFRPGALAAFGLDYESVSARNPAVVYASISGYGQHGPWRSRMAYAPTVQAETGITANTADHFERTRTLRSDSLSHADVYSGLHAAIAILACLTERERTGKGQYVDVAMAAVMLSINERVHADLSDEELGDERPILGATDGPFFEGPHGERFASPMSLVGSMSFPFYLAAMRRPDLGRDPRFLTPELRLRNLAALHRIVQEWIWTHHDMASLDAQLDEAKIATGQVRSVREFADSDWAREWHAVRTVSDRSGGEIRIPGRPWHFADQVAGDDDQLAARQGEHNAEVLAELGFGAPEIAALEAYGALVQPSSNSTASERLLPIRQAKARTMACRASPTAAPTTVPLMRMYCRSRPRSSSSWLDVSAASHRSIVPVTSPASSSWN
jgi:crotonobetainyl-CoA:carnitine CoA-transferase CaiB-like acyl-CoA transferase